MRLRLLFLALLICVIGIPVSVWCSVGKLPLPVIIVSAVAMLLLLFVWRRVMRPVKLAETGLQLLESGEWNNRLVPSWFPEAQKVVNVYNDILSRLSDESRRVEEKNNLLEMLVEASPTGIAMMDFDGHITLANRAFLELAGVSSLDQIMGKKPEEIERELIRRCAAISPGKVEIIRQTDLKIVRCRHLWFMEKGFRKPFLMLEPMTEEVRRTERDSYRKIIRTISHEINNSFMGINTFLETLAADDTIAADYKEVAQSCLDRNNDLAAFVKGYADIVRLPAPTLREVDPDRMIADMVPFLQQMAGGIEISIIPSDTALTIQGDVVMLQQVIINLVKNGIESENSDKICIRTRRENGDCVIEIADTGAGIDPKTAEKLFSPFFTTKKSGRGLGLAIASEVLDAHGATYSLQSLPKERAPYTTAFTIRLRIDYARDRQQADVR